MSKRDYTHIQIALSQIHNMIAEGKLYREIADYYGVKNEKVIRKMKKYDLLAEIRRRRRWTTMGQQLHRYENLLNRQFQAERSNHKWVTDISYWKSFFVLSVQNGAVHSGCLFSWLWVVEENPPVRRLTPQESEPWRRTIGRRKG